VADNNDPTLRNALDAVNAGRRWTLFGVIALLAAVLLLLLFFFAMLIPRIVQPPGGVDIDVPAATQSVEVNQLIPLKALWVVAAMQLFIVACGTIAVMLHASKMTRVILRAVEETRK
jgi:hypothetical protein